LLKEFMNDVVNQVVMRAKQISLLVPLLTSSLEAIPFLQVGQNEFMFWIMEVSREHGWHDLPVALKLFLRGVMLK
jgi:hypothetical protein